MAKRFPTPASLTKAPLIVDESISFIEPPCDWSAWFAAAGIDHTPSHGPRFSQGDHATDAAVSGVGAVLGRRSLVVKDLDEGRLVAPYGMALGTGAHFRFLCAQSMSERPKVQTFLNWVLDEIQKTAHITDAMHIIAPQ
jgi:LysR family glycine cleavage system transcriptional activator